jgi:hypothetical protein
MTPEQHAAINRIFAEHGYSETVQVAHALNQDEYTLLVRSAAPPDQTKAELVVEARSILGRPVSVRFAA